MRLGRPITEQDLADDWTMTHEFVHMALSSLPDNQSWMEEGLATYVEPMAPAQVEHLPSGRCRRARSRACRKGSLSEVISVWTRLAAGAPPTGEGRCFASSQMSKFTGRQRIAKDCSMRYALSLPLAVRSTKSGLS